MAIGKSKLHDLLNRKVISDAQAWLNSFDTITKEKIIDWIQEDQLLEQGIDATGRIIGVYRKTVEGPGRGYPKIKGRPYNLSDTGEFFRSMFVRVLTDEIQIEGDGQKDGVNILLKYGSKVLNLTDENLQKLIELVKAKFIEQLKKSLGIG